MDEVANEIAYISDQDGNNEIYSMNADGSNKTKLGSNLGAKPGIVEEYVWSPDGRRIAYWVYDNTPGWSYVVNVDGSGLTELPVCRDLAWSPDARQIACSGIYVMNADGSQRARLTNNSPEDRVPVWSPPLR